VGDEEFVRHVNEDVTIPVRTKHRVTNPGNNLLIFIEVQCGNYLGEDDITRFEDDYNRTRPPAR
jgi:mannose-6-phosphate isomerase-like protein (cupin superfamily)